jgi:hypothetical protein
MQALRNRTDGFEIHLVPNRIPVGKGDQKRYTTVVEVQVDRQHLYQAREFMIELFDTHQSMLPREVFFVPTPTNGTMDYELYYQHLSIHHAHVSSLRSFAISNVRDIKTDIMIYGPDGVSDPRTMTFEQALLSQVRSGTADPLFYSIEPTQASATEGRYLLVTHQDTIKEAEQCIDTALTALNGNTSNRAKIQLDNAPIARTNRVTTSPRFQEYASKLQQMIPSSIVLPTPTTNAWKRRPPSTMNLTDDSFPPLTTPKKPRKNASAETATITTLDTSETSTGLSTFTDELAKIRQENKDMQRQLQAQFHSAMQELELRMEQRTQTLVASMGQTLTQAVDHMTAQTARNDERLNSFLASFQSQADRMTAQMDRMFQARDQDTATSPDDTPRRRTKARHLPASPLNSRRVPMDTWDIDSDDEVGSRSPHARRASPHNTVQDPTTGGRT